MKQLSVLLLTLTLLICTVRTQFTLENIDERLLSADFRRKNGPVVRASNGIQFSTMMKDRLQVAYTGCSDGWLDLLYWATMLYGDWYGNQGSNTVAYFYY